MLRLPDHKEKCNQPWGLAIHVHNLKETLGLMPFSAADFSKLAARRGQWESARGRICLETIGKQKYRN